MGTVVQEFEYLTKASRAINKDDIESAKQYISIIEQDLKGEYIDNIKDKVERWIEITKYEMFRECTPVNFYIQAKMLYRDGYYEAAIMLSRSICEQFCYDYLSSIPNKFKDRQEIEETNFRTLINYIVVPKIIDKQSFQDILSNVENDDRNILKANYVKLSDGKFEFKQTTDKTKLKKIIKAIKTGANNLEWYQYDLINEVYDIGNDFVHPKSDKNPKTNAKEIIAKIGEVLFITYGIRNIQDILGNVVKTAYSNYPDICKCNHLLIDIYTSPEEAKENE